MARYGGAEYERGHGLAQDAGGDLILLSRCTADTDFGNGAVTGGFLCLARISPADLSCAWSQGYGGDVTLEQLTVRLDGGDVLVAGQFNGDLTVGADSFSGTSDLFVVKVEGASGAALWAVSLPSSYPVWPAGVTMAGGSAVLGGTFHELVTPFGTFTGVGGADLFLAELDPGTGALQSIRPLSGTGAVELLVDVAAGGTSLALTGSFDGTLDFGGGERTALAADAFIAVFEP